MKSLHSIKEEKTNWGKWIMETKVIDLNSFTNDVTYHINYPLGYQPEEFLHWNAPREWECTVHASNGSLVSV